MTTKYELYKKTENGLKLIFVTKRKENADSYLVREWRNYSLINEIAFGNEEAKGQFMSNYTIKECNPRTDCEECIFACPDYVEGIGTGIECRVEDAMTDKDIELSNNGDCPKFEKCDVDWDDVPIHYLFFAEWYKDRKLKEAKQ